MNTIINTIPDCSDVGTLIRWLRGRWIEISGKRTTPIVSPERFLLKLRSGCHIDRDTFLAMRETLRAYYASEFGDDLELHPVVGSVKGGEVCQPA